jgi:hypothetical protein
MNTPSKVAMALLTRSETGQASPKAGHASRRAPVNLIHSTLLAVTNRVKAPASVAYLAASQVTLSLYSYGNQAVDTAKLVVSLLHGHLETNAVNDCYLIKCVLQIETFGRGMAWLDTGTQDSLLESSMFIATCEKRQGLKMACPEELAWRNRWLEDDGFEMILVALGKKLQQVSA